MKVEPLESRRLMSVTVVEGYPGFYEILGDDSANTISVGVSQDDETMTVDGVTYGGVVDVSIHAHGGDDTITAASSPDGWIGVSVVAGEGNDSVSINFAGAIWAGPGDDVLRLTNSFRGEVYGDQGGDRIYIAGGCVDPEIVGGPGDDLIDATANLYGVVMHGGAGDDAILGSNHADQIYGDQGADTLYGYGGDDAFHARDGGGADQIFGGSGTDILFMDNADVEKEGVEYTYLA